MPSLLDIGSLTVTTDIRGVQVEVSGISGESFLHLLDRYPEFRKVMSGGAVTPDVSVLMKQAPGAVGAVIAAACGNFGDPKAEEIARKLSIGEQGEILLKIWTLTFPRGVQNFIEALEGLAKQVVGASGWDQAMRSQEPSNSASTSATPQT